VNNPTLTEFCFGMIGRADIEGSKSNVAMNAWLPQASSVIPAIMIAQSFLNLCKSVDDCTLSGGRSPYLRCIRGCTHTLASVEPPSCNRGVGEPGQLRIVSILQIFTHPFQGLYVEALPSRFGIKDLSRLPRIQVYCRLTHKHKYMSSD
jgi:hypothetical protein